MYYFFRRVRKIATSDYSLRYVMSCLSVCLYIHPYVRPSVRMEQLSSHWKDFHKIWYYYFKICRGKFNFHWNPTRVTSTLHEDQCTFTIVSRWIILRMRNVSDEDCGEVDKIKTHILYPITFFLKSYPLWHNVEKYGTAGKATDDNIIQRMRFACWITKATDTHS
jgi:hypothetical protein